MKLNLMDALFGFRRNQNAKRRSDFFGRFTTVAKG